MKSIFALSIYYRIKIYINQVKFYFSSYTKQLYSEKNDDYWEQRIVETLECPDINKIPKDKNAGKIIKGKIIMHNGIKIFPLSYYRLNYLKLLQRTEGIHEPQEEFVFSMILKLIPNNSVMIELGSYWSFYSIWFNKKIENAKNFMIEPELSQLEYGKYNFKLNKIKGTFFRAFVSSKSYFDKGNFYISIDDFTRKFKINQTAILHSDIQGFELDMLKGSTHNLFYHKIDFIFISTHSNDLHTNCENFLKQYNYQIIVSINIDESYTVDGLIFAHSPKVKLDTETTELLKNVSKKYSLNNNY